MKFSLNSTLLVFLLTVCSGSAALAVTPNPEPMEQQVTQADLSGGTKTQRKEGPPSIFEDSLPTTQQQKAFLDVQVKVPHEAHPKDVFNIYPYPVKPPAAQPCPPLPEKGQGMKQLLLQTGYHLRSSGDKPFQTGGWRWQYCYKAAVRKSGLGVPHTIFSEYQWVRDITPYMSAETKRWNAFELQRWKRYEKARADFERYRADAESDAVQQGIYPMQLPRRGFGWVQTTIPTGTWWLTCTRKIPGLTYYWQVPLTAAPGEKIKIELTELNALIIEGGW